MSFPISVMQVSAGEPLGPQMIHEARRRMSRTVRWRRNMNDFRVELKVCEGCGGLWLRARELKTEKHGAYCSSCVRWLAEFPEPKHGQVRGEAHRKRRRRNRAAHAIGARTGSMVEVEATEMELVGVGGGR
jgi:hypothetical protein